MPVAFVPKLKKRSDERRRENTLLGPTWHPTCYSFTGHCIKSHHILKVQWARESRCHCADKESEAQGGWGTYPARGSTQVSLGTATLTNTRCSWPPQRRTLIIPRILTIHHSPCCNQSSVWHFTQLVLLYFPTVSRKILATNQMHVKQIAIDPSSFDWTIWNRNSRDLGIQYRAAGRR